MNKTIDNIHTTAGVIAGELLAKRLIASADIYKVRDILEPGLIGCGGWVDVNETMPDADLTVLVTIDPADPTFSEPVWLGYFDGEVWRSVEGGQIVVTHWTQLPYPAKAEGGK